MNFPAELRYTKDHEWISIEGNIATIGITDFAQHELGDIVYVDINTVVNCEGGKKYFSGLKITDSHLGTYETTVKEAFAASSNVAFAKLADQFYHAQPQKFLDHLHKMRLDTYTGVDIVASSGFPLIKRESSFGLILSDVSIICKESNVKYLLFN